MASTPQRRFGLRRVPGDLDELSIALQCDESTGIEKERHGVEVCGKLAHTGGVSRPIFADVVDPHSEREGERSGKAHSRSLLAAFVQSLQALEPTIWRRFLQTAWAMLARCAHRSPSSSSLSR